MTDTSTTENWVRRVEAWRASGERAEDFSRREGYAASTLRWWASKLKREVPAAARDVQLARVIRTPSTATGVATTSAIMIEVGAAGPRVAVSRDADRATLTMVLEVLGVGVAR